MIGTIGYMQLFNDKKLESIRKYLMKKKQSIAIAESVTSGLLQFAFSNIPDASTFFQGGITAFNIGQKTRHLHIEPLHAQQVNCVSKQVAEEMAVNVASEFTSNWSAAITGYASPVPESGNKLFAYYAICFKGKIKASGILRVQTATPTDVQLKLTNKIIDLLAAQMK